MATGRRSAPLEGAEGFIAIVGERVRLERQVRGWTQVELAHATDLSSNFIARLERGETGASFYVASRIAEALGITLNRLAQSPSGTRRTKRGIG